MASDRGRVTLCSFAFDGLCLLPLGAEGNLALCIKKRDSFAEKNTPGEGGAALDTIDAIEVAI